MLTLPTKFKTELLKKNQPSYIVKLLESEIKNEQTLQADWAANSSESNVDYTPTPPETGDVILAGGANVGGIWTQKTSGTMTARDKAAAVNINGKMYVFGGEYPIGAPPFAVVLNDMWEYNISGNSWTQKASGASKRFGHSAVAYNGKMYIFGGADVSSVYYNDVWEYNPVNDSYSQKTCSGTPPTTRFAHSAIVFNGKMIIFGGRDNNLALCNDVHELDLTTFAWSGTKTTYGTSPTQRQYHSATVYNDSMIIFGGQYDSSPYHYQDTFSLDLTSWTWSSKANGPAARSGHNAIQWSAMTVIFGGQDNSASQYDTVFFYDCAANSWSTKTAGGGARRFHVAVLEQSKMYIHGGITGTSTCLVTTYEDWFGYYSSGYIRTPTMNLGSTPTVDGLWKFQNLLPSGTSITYEAWASDTGSFAGEETSLGTVVDGQAITVRKRYYRVKATLTANTAQDASPTLRSIMARFPVYRGISDNPLLGYEASLLSVSALSTKIGDFEPSSISQVTINTAFSKSLSDYLKTKYPKNKEVRLMAGFIADGYVEADYFEYYRGLIDEWSIEEKDTISIKIKDFSKQWDVPVPAKWQSSSDDKTWTAMHPIDVMLDIFRGYIGSTDSELDQSSFNDVKLATPGWVVTRTITGNTVQAKELLEELRRLLSAYFIPQPNGRIKIKRWNASESAAMTFTDSDFITKKWEANAASLMNQLNIYFGHAENPTYPTASEIGGDDLKNFHAWDLSGDATSKANWGETAAEEIKDKWTRIAQSSQVAVRSTILLNRYANPPEKIPCTIDMRFMEIETGDIVNATTLRAPSSDMGGITNKAFQVIQKTPDFNKDRLNLVLLRRGSS
jgi:N-acetylneuraminic acid mutarotase